MAIDLSQLIVRVLGCWLLADFIAGFWHWLEDRYFDERWPIIGKYIAKPNQLHHEQPNAFLAGNYWTRNYTALIPAAAAFACVPSWWMVWLFVGNANEFHAWSHQRCSPIIRAIQTTGFLQSPREHGLHHRAPFETRYCVSTDWLNPFLDLVGFWRWLEWFISPLVKVRNV